MKICSICNTEKPLSEYYASKGFPRTECKECHLKKKHEREAANPYKTVIHNMISGIFHRTQWSTEKAQNKSYAGVKCLLGSTPEEARRTLHRHFELNIKRLMSEGKKPSVDRKESSGDYSVDNIEIIPLEENVRKGAQKGTEMTKRPIGVYDSGNPYKSYDSVSEAAKALGLKRDTIIRHAKNGTETRYGLSFKYL